VTFYIDINLKGPPLGIWPKGFFLFFLCPFGDHVAGAGFFLHLKQFYSCFPLFFNFLGRFFTFSLFTWWSLIGKHCHSI